MRREDNVRLQHMLDAAVEALQIVADKSRPSVVQDRVLVLALTRLLEVLGEAAGRVTRETQYDHPEIPWQQIIGMRNRLIHGYDSVDLGILWQVIEADLPPLVESLRKALPD